MLFRSKGIKMKKAIRELEKLAMVEEEAAAVWKQYAEEDRQEGRDGEYANEIAQGAFHKALVLWGAIEVLKEKDE